MSEKEKMLGLERQIGTLARQIKTLAKSLHENPDVPLDVQNIAIIVEERADFIKTASCEISSYLELRNS